MRPYSAPFILCISYFAWLGKKLLLSSVRERRAPFDIMGPPCYTPRENHDIMVSWWLMPPLCPREEFPLGTADLIPCSPGGRISDTFPAIKKYIYTYFSCQILPAVKLLPGNNVLWNPRLSRSGLSFVK